MVLDVKEPDVSASCVELLCNSFNTLLLQELVAQQLKFVDSANKHLLFECVNIFCDILHNLSARPMLRQLSSSCKVHSKVLVWSAVPPSSPVQ
jgi:hypothetical protein